LLESLLVLMGCTLESHTLHMYYCTYDLYKQLAHMHMLCGQHALVILMCIFAAFCASNMRC
jgi:hypothetical protein